MHRKQSAVEILCQECCDAVLNQVPSHVLFIADDIIIEHSAKKNPPCQHVHKVVVNEHYTWRKHPTNFRLSMRWFVSMRQFESNLRTELFEPFQQHPTKISIVNMKAKQC